MCLIGLITKNYFLVKIYKSINKIMVKLLSSQKTIKQDTYEDKDNFTFFAQEKWKIASDKGGSGNTANIGSIQKIEDILSGNGVFAKAGEEIFDDYWANFGKMQIVGANKKRKALSSFDEYIKYRGLSTEINNPKASRKKVKK